MEQRHHSSRLAMTWKDRQRTRLPVVDLDENPFCVERRTNEEWHTIQLNKNPSLATMTSADVPRTASFMVDTEKPVRDFSKKKRSLLAWSLRALTTSDVVHRESEHGKPKQTRRTSKTVPSEPKETDIADFFNQEPSDRRSPADRIDIDIDTLPNLEPYRREVVAQQPITFGHRPLSASRMFNPCTMATSCGVRNDNRDNGGRKGGESGTRRGNTRAQRQPHLKQDRGRTTKTRRTTGLSAPMLKALLRGDTPTAAESGGAKAAVSTAHRDDIHRDHLDPTGSNNQYSPAKANCQVVNGRDDLSDSSVNSGGDRFDESTWRSIDPAGGGVRGDLKATWLTDGEPRERGGWGDSVEELELRRIFSDERPPWDGTPAPLPAPQNVRRAISSLLMPDPDERLKDKLIKSRKSAAGIPVTASSTKDEKDEELHPFNSTPSGRWKGCPATPRAVIAREEIKNLSEARRERDSAMAKRVRQAELRVFFNKIAPSEQLYRNTLQAALGRFRHLGAVAVAA